MKNKRFNEWFLPRMGGMTQAEVSRRCGKGVSEGLISKIVSNQKPVTPNVAIKIARAMKEDPIYILYLAGYLTEEEYGLEKNWLEDMMDFKDICNMIRPLSKSNKNKVRAILVAALGLEGGDTQETAWDLETGHG